MYCWSVWLAGRCIETVFYTDDCTEEFVKADLIEQDFDPAIYLHQDCRMYSRRMYTKQDVDAAIKDTINTARGV